MKACTQDGFQFNKFLIKKEFIMEELVEFKIIYCNPFKEKVTHKINE